MGRTITLSNLEAMTLNKVLEVALHSLRNTRKRDAELECMEEVIFEVKRQLR